MRFFCVPPHSLVLLPRPPLPPKPLIVIHGMHVFFFFPQSQSQSPRSTVETEKLRAERLEEMLEDSRRERDAECERLQQNIDSQKEQLDVSASTTPPPPPPLDYPPCTHTHTPTPSPTLADDGQPSSRSFALLLHTFFIFFHRYPIPVLCFGVCAGGFRQLACVPVLQWMI